MPNAERLRVFVQEMMRVVDGQAANEALLMDHGADLLGKLISTDDWLPDEFAAPSADSYRQYLLHCDPHERFSIVSFVWQPGQRTPIHDHLTWGLVGQLRGHETCEEFALDANGRYLKIGAHEMNCRDVDRVSPTIGDIHAVSNSGDGTSVSIHVYGGNIGARTRHAFDTSGAAHDFISGYHNAHLPNIWRPD